jgi:hypothetical protein
VPHQPLPNDHRTMPAESARSTRPADAADRSWPSPPRSPAAAAGAAGADPLARIQARIATRRRQTVVVLAVLAVAGATLATGHSEALAVVVACVAAEIALAASLLMLASDRHVRALELIAAGHGELPVAAVRRDRRRLLTASHRAALARSLDELADEAPARLACPASGRPLYAAHVLTALSAELHATARLLCRDRAAVAGVAMTELLLTAHDSALYGTDSTRLRQELPRINFALQSTHAQSHADPSDTPARR